MFPYYTQLVHYVVHRTQLAEEKARLNRPPIPEGKVRVDFRCVCGDIMYWDVTELRPGGAASQSAQLDSGSIGIRARRARDEKLAFRILVGFVLALIALFLLGHVWLRSSMSLGKLLSSIWPGTMLSSLSPGIWIFLASITCSGAAAMDYMPKWLSVSCSFVLGSYWIWSLWSREERYCYRS